MADNFLNDSYLAELWQKSLNTFGLRQEVYNNPKTLYNLGVYDSYVDNGDGTVTITRQTGYVDLGKLTYSLSQDSDYWYWVASFSKGQYYSANTQTQCSHPIYQAVRYNNADFNTNNRIAYSNATMVVRTTSTSELPKGLLQFKLATSYTEKVLKSQSLNTLNASGSAWIQDEYDKTLNLLNPYDYSQNNATASFTNNSITITGVSGKTYQNCTFFTVDNPGGKTYTLSFGTVSYTGNARPIVGLYDGTDFLMPTVITSNWSYTFTVRANAGQLRVVLYNRWGSTGGDGTATFSNPMLVEGATALPYQEYKGELVHKGIISTALLWQNGNPDSAFARQTITTANMSGYKYLVIECCANNLSDDNKKERIFFKQRYMTPQFAFRLFNTNGTDIFYRYCLVKTSTTVEIQDSTIDNYRLIPIAIYGTNVL